MEKHRLKMEDLELESFETTTVSSLDANGTVFGEACTNACTLAYDQLCTEGCTTYCTVGGGLTCDSCPTVVLTCGHDPSCASSSATHVNQVTCYPESTCLDPTCTAQPSCLATEIGCC
jgi:hypothetical protein